MRLKEFADYSGIADMDFWRKVCAEEGVVRTYRKGECLQRCGEVPRMWGLVMKGYFKLVVATSEGEERICGFAFAHSLVGDYEGCVHQRPALTDIVAVTEAEVLTCTTTVLRRILTENPRIHLSLAESLLQQLYGSFTDLYRFTPRERYQLMLRRYPGLLQHITLKELASFLQITPTHLSRIRKELLMGGRELST